MKNMAKMIVVAVAVAGLLTASQAVARRKWHPSVEPCGQR
jgi:hypothetical protein